jgi:HK97 family phage major capsid protein
MTSTEQIAAFENRRAANVARMGQLMDEAGKAGTTLDATQSEEYDTLEGEIKAVDEHLARLRTHEVIMKASAVEVPAAAGKSAAAASAARGGQAIVVKRNVQPGWAFARYVGALALCRGNKWEAAEFAKRWQDSTPEVGISLKAAMAAGTTTDADWAEPLVEYQTMASEFIDMLRPATIIGRIQNPGLRRVPFNIRVAGKTQGSTVGWVGEALAKPVSELKFNEVTLGWAKAAGIVVISEELARFSRPGAEDLISQDLRDTMQQFLDTQFVLPTVAAVAGVNPASITNGVTPIGLNAAASVATWTTAITAAFTAMAAAGLSPTHWITTPAVALSLGTLRTTQDIFAFPGLGVSGGTLMGLPVITSTAAPTGQLILICAPEIFLADEGGVSVDVSREASVMLDSAPVAGTTAYTSLWQHNLVAIKAERYINWAKRRTAAVQMIDSTDVT